MLLFSFRKKKKRPELRKSKSTGNIAREKAVVSTKEIKVGGGSTSSTSDYSSESDDSDNESVASLPTERPRHMMLPRVSITKSSSSPSTPQEQQRSSYFSSGDLELLLSQETQARIDAQEKAAVEAAAAAAAAEASSTPPRKTTLKFELPVTPTRSRSPGYSAYARPRQRWSLPDEKMLEDPKKKKKSLWKIKGSEDDESEARQMKVGDKVYLLHRPLPIVGYVRFMGDMDGQAGWVGVELDSRVGKNDGSVNGHRYFQTDPHRGIFVRQSELGFA